MSPGLADRRRGLMTGCTPKCPGTLNTAGECDRCSQLQGWPFVLRVVEMGSLGPWQEAQGVGEQDRGCRWAPRVPTVLSLWGQCDCGTENLL